MKVLTLRQPYATLVVIGEKKIETRGFAASHRGPILIHSSSNMTEHEKKLCKTEPFKTALKGVDVLHLGCIIGKVDIINVSPTVFYRQCSKSIPLNEGKKYSRNDWLKEFRFGNYSAGRFGWLLKDHVAFKHHIHFSGGVGFTKEFDERICLQCGCTEDDCSACIAATGEPCYWVSNNLCSACAIPHEVHDSLKSLKAFKSSLKKAFQ